MEQPIEKRDWRNYPGLTTVVPNVFAGTREQVFVMPTVFRLTAANFCVEFEGWRSREAFADYAAPVGFLRAVYPPPTEDAAAIMRQYVETFDAIRQYAFEFLEIPATDYNITHLEINMLDLRVSLTARHKERNQLAIYNTPDVDEFVRLKAENPELVQLLVGFAWEYGKARDEFLRTLKAIEAVN